MSDSDQLSDLADSNKPSGLESPLSTSPSSDMLPSQSIGDGLASLPSDDGEIQMESPCISNISLDETDVTRDEDNDVPNIHPVCLSSFLPLLQALAVPGLKCVNGIWHLRGPIPDEAFRKLSDYAFRVTKFTLTDIHSEGDVVDIDAGTWFRILQVHGRQNPNSTSFFPSLKELRISDADSALAQISLFLEQSLETLDLSNIPINRSDTVLSFLHTLAEVAPNLSNFAFDGSLPFNDLSGIYARFHQLRSLKITVTRGTNLSKESIREIGQLPGLELLVLDAIDADYMQTSRGEKSPSPMPLSSPDVPAQVWDTSFNNTQCAFEPGSGWGSVGPTRPLASFGLFVAEPPVRPPSPAPSIPCIPDELSSSPHEVEVNTPDESSTPPRQVSYLKLKMVHVHGQMELISDLLDMVDSREVADVALTLVSHASKPVLSRKKGKGAKASSTQTQIKSTIQGFSDTLEQIATTWNLVLNSICIGYKEQNPTSPTNITLPLATFHRLILLPSLHTLKISGYKLDSDYGNALHCLTTLDTDRRSKLVNLHLPIAAGDKGISLTRLRTIVESCPSLISFQCGFKHLSNVPKIPDDGVVFGLKYLVAGNPTAYGAHRRLIEVAQYLDALFPDLKTMETREGCNAVEWEEIYDLVKMCQASRSYHAKHE